MPPPAPLELEVLELDVLLLEAPPAPLDAGAPFELDALEPPAPPALVVDALPLMDDTVEPAPLSVELVEPPEPALLDEEPQ